MTAPELVNWVDSKFTLLPTIAQSKIPGLDFSPVVHVDLLAISKALSEHDFREYIDASREVRASAKRQ